MRKLFSLMLSLVLLLDMVAPSYAQAISSAQRFQNNVTRAVYQDSYNHQQRDFSDTIGSNPSVVEAQRRAKFGVPIKKGEMLEQLAHKQAYLATAEEAAYLKEIKEVVSLLDASAAQEDKQEIKPLSAEEFKKLYRQVNEAVLDEALKMAKNDEERANIRQRWEKALKENEAPAYEEYKKDFAAQMAEAEEEFYAHLKELATKALMFKGRPVKFYYASMDDEKARKLSETFEPIEEFLPIMQYSFGSRVVKDNVRRSGSKVLSARLDGYIAKVSKTSADNIEGSQMYSDFLRASHALASLGTQSSDAYKLGTALEATYDKAGIAPSFIQTIGGDLLGMKDIGGYQALTASLFKIADEADNDVWQNDSFNITNIVKAYQSAKEGITELNGKWDAIDYLTKGNIEFARPKFMASFYDPQTGVSNENNAWIDLGKEIALQARGNGKKAGDKALEAAINGLLVRESACNSRIVDFSKGWTRTRFNLLLTGLLSGRFNVNIQGTTQAGGTEIRQLCNGQAVTTQAVATEPLFKETKELMAKNGLTQREWLSLILYRRKTLDIDPSTVRYIRNNLYNGFDNPEKAKRFYLTKSARPTPQEVEEYKQYQKALRSAGIADFIIGEVGTFVILWILTDGLISVAGSAFRFGSSYIKATRMATQLTRASKGHRVLRRSGRLMRRALLRKTGAQNAASAFLKGASRNGKYVSQTAQALRVTGGTAAGTAGAVQSATTIVLDNIVRVVPQGMKWVRIEANGVARFELITDSAEAVTQLAKQYGVATSAITDAVNGSVSAVTTIGKAAQKVYTTTGAAGVHSGYVGQVMSQGATTAAATAEKVAQKVVQTAPKWHQVPSVNALGNTVLQWEPVTLARQGVTAGSGISKLSFAERLGNWWNSTISSGKNWVVGANLWWNTAFMPLSRQMGRLAMSRYGVMAGATYGAPITAGEAINAAGRLTHGVELVENLSMAQRGWISAEQLYAGAGASARIGTVVNEGGVAAQRFAAQTLTRQRTISSAASVASKAAKTAKTVPLNTAGNAARNSWFLGGRTGTLGVSFIPPVWNLIPSSWRKGVRSLFTSDSQKAASVKEPVGLHENNVVEEMEEVPMAAVGPEDLLGGEDIAPIVTLGEDGFKFTVEDSEGEEFILDNVTVSVSSAVKNTEGYNRIVRDSNGIFTFQNLTLDPKKLERFFVVLSNEDGALKALVESAAQQSFEDPLVIKIKRKESGDSWIVRSVRAVKTLFSRVPSVVQIPLFSGTSSVLADLDVSLLPLELAATAKKGSLSLSDDGKQVFYVTQTGEKTPLDDYYVRLPKQESGKWVLALQNAPQTPFRLNVYSSQNKVFVMTRLVPMTQLGTSKAFGSIMKMLGLHPLLATGIPMFANNGMPLLTGFFVPWLRRWGDANVYRFGVGISTITFLAALSGGLTGFSNISEGNVTPYLTGVVIASMISLGIASTLTRSNQGNLIFANQGTLTQKKKKKEKRTYTEAPTARFLLRRIREFFTEPARTDGRLMEMVQNAGAMKNLGTGLFLAAPFIFNLISTAVGSSVRADFSLGFWILAGISAYSFYKMLTLPLKDSFPRDIPTLEKTLKKAEKKLLAQIQKQAALPEKERKYVEIAKELNKVMSPLVRAITYQEKRKEKDVFPEVEKETLARVSDALRAQGVSEAEIQQMQKDLQAAFDVAGRRHTSVWRVARMTTIPSSLLAMILLTVHELGTSSAFSYTLTEAIKLWLGSDTATFALSQALIGVTLYGSAFASRMLGNFISRRLTEGTMYLLSSMTSVIGTGLMIAANGTNIPLLLTGAFIAAFGMGNFFAQLFEFMTNLHSDYRPEVATLITYTMPVAAALVIPFEWLKEMAGIPLDLILSEVALFGSFVSLPQLFAGSSILRSIGYYSQRVRNAVMPSHNSGNPNDGATGGTTEPTAMPDPTPAN